jgi:hypothetical protein
MSFRWNPVQGRLTSPEPGPSAPEPSVVNPLQPSGPYKERCNWLIVPMIIWGPPAGSRAGPHADARRWLFPRHWRVDLSRSLARVAASREPRGLHELFRAHRRVASEVGLGLLDPAARVLPRLIRGDHGWPRVWSRTDGWPSRLITWPATGGAGLAAAMVFSSKLGYGGVLQLRPRPGRP